nr:retrovirus-related Pol polyprotein from transposon TNT 1-94 [Tanacetum cinerariifolium]
GNPQHALNDKGVINSGCLRHMTGNISYLFDFEEINEGYVAFGGNPKGGKITGKVNTACYVQNRILVTKPHNKTSYELLLGRTPSIGFMRPFGCPVTILNTLDPLGKFDGKTDEGFLVGYSNIDADATFEVKEPEYEVYVSPSSSAKTKKHDDKTKREAKGRVLTKSFTAIGPSNNAVSLNFEFGGKSLFVDPSQYPNDPDMLALEGVTYSDNEEDVGAEADFSNLETSITVSPIPTSRVHNDHHVTQIIIDLSSAPQTRSMTRMVKDQVDLPKGKRAIGLKWVFRNKKDEKGIVFKNKARLVAQGHTQEEGIDYEEVFTPVARIEAMWLFLAYASFMSFMVYQMDVKSAFFYGTIEEEVYVCQPLGFEDPNYPDKVYKVVKALYGLHPALRAWYETLANYLLENSFLRRKLIRPCLSKELCKAFEKLMKNKFQMSSMGELTFFLGLQVKQKEDGIFISQDKYVAEILRKFGLTDGKLASTPIDTEKPLPKDPDGEDVDVHTYRLIITAVSLKLMLFGLTIDDVYLLLLELARMGYEKPSTKLTFYKAFFSTQWNFLIHTILQCLSAKRTAWNEFSSFMASAVICLTTGRKFNFLKYIFDSLVRNVDSPSKFYMYPRFLQLMINAQIADLSSHNTKYTSPALTQKVFANMRRVGKGFSGVDTPLFEVMLVPQKVHNDIDAAAEDEDAVVPTSPSPTPASIPPSQQELILLSSQVETTLPPSPHQTPIAYDLYRFTK